MQRFPNGITQDGFYQKDIGDYFPDWIPTVTVKKLEGGTTTYVVCNNSATLVYLANQACITQHAWLSRIDKLNYPDRMIFDLDPVNDKQFDLVKETGFKLNKLLDEFNLRSYVMLTGSRGIHIIVPIKRLYKFDTVRACARALADILVKRDGEKHLTTEPRFDKRKGRLFIDATRNAYAQTTVAPYSVRALQGAPVATPVTWNELESSKITAQSFSIKNIEMRLEKIKDPWAGINKDSGVLSTMLNLICK
jgi:bifunctional non-homologous end joining protein LigD